MPARSGRLEKRTRLEIPLQITRREEPSATERTITENVCSLGARVLTRAAKQLDERVTINSLAGNLRVLARVVYCERLPDGRFGVGLQFNTQVAEWPRSSLTDVPN